MSAVARSFGATTCGASRGTLGELYQGPIWLGAQPEIAIVSLPVEKYSWCYFTADADGDASYEADLADRPKAVAAVARFLDIYGLAAPRGRWEIHSELPVGKGMASSTADIVAVLRCLFNGFAIPYDQRVVTGILHGIERADAVFLDRLALYLSARHQAVTVFDAAVEFTTCYVVEDATVNTEEATEALLAHYGRHRSAYSRCLSAILDAFRRNDVGEIGRCATASAELSQAVMPKQCFADVIEHRRAFGADGVFVAHTGALVGYLLRRAPSRTQIDELSAFFRSRGLQCAFAQAGAR